MARDVSAARLPKPSGQHPNRQSFQLTKKLICNRVELPIASTVLGAATIPAAILLTAGTQWNAT